jgi:hypothetical protein
MHPDIVESKPGTCPLCKMNLVPTRLDASWMCPLHAAVVEPASGTCRLCGRTLVPVTVTLTWSCRSDVSATHLEPGVCADGSPRIAKRTLRPHGNHNPQHGGQFFMAPDNWHHVEGTYPRPGLFRVHIYDDYARPLDATKLGAVVGRLVTEERFDPTTRTTTELRAVPLRIGRDGVLEAAPQHRAWPMKGTLKVTLKTGEPEHRFDFTFPAATVDASTQPAPAGAVSSNTRPSSGASRTRAARGAVSRASPVPAGTAPATAVSVPVTTPGVETIAAPSSAAVEIPSTIPEILDAIRARRSEIDALIGKGDFAAVWVPAFQAKDLALALEQHLPHLLEPQRAVATPALFRLVQGAWHLDAVGDGGNREEIESAFLAFHGAVGDVDVAFAAGR